MISHGLAGWLAWSLRATIAQTGSCVERQATKWQKRIKLTLHVLVMCWRYCLNEEERDPWMGPGSEQGNEAGQLSV